MCVHAQDFKGVGTVKLALASVHLKVAGSLGSGVVMFVCGVCVYASEGRFTTKF